MPAAWRQGLVGRAPQGPGADLLGLPGRGLAGRQPRQLAQLRNHGGHGLPFDELHRVIVHAAIGAHGMHRHDVRVMQVGRRLRFLLEARQLLGIEGGGEGEHLEGDAPAQRNLLRFVDNAHAAPADLADDAKIAEAPPLGEECSGGILSRCRIAQPRGRVVQQG